MVEGTNKNISFPTDMGATTHIVPPTTIETHNHSLGCVVLVIWAIHAL